MWNSLSRGKSALISTIVYTLLAGIFTWATVVDYNEAEFYRENIGFAIAPIAVTLLVVVAFLIHKKHYSVIKEKRWLSRLFTAIFMILHLTKYSLQGTTQGRYLTGGVPPVRFSM